MDYCPGADGLECIGGWLYTSIPGRVMVFPANRKCPVCKGDEMQAQQPPGQDPGQYAPGQKPGQPGQHDPSKDPSKHDPSKPKKPGEEENDKDKDKGKR